MDFVRLDPEKYTPDLIIEGYTSLIWTERFDSPGEFELKSADVDVLLVDLPENALVSHLETAEVMMVETHEIGMVGEGADAYPEITIKGRSASVILEHRWVESTYGKKRRMRRKYSAVSAAAVLISNAIDNPSGKDITRGDSDPDTELEKNDYPWNTKDVIPNVAVTDSVAVDGETRWWQLTEGMLYPQLQKIIMSQDLGLRCIRPVPNNSATVVTVKAWLANRGEIVRTWTMGITQLRFDIYSTVDRSTWIQFSQLQGHIDKPQYLTSVKDYKTVVEVKSDVISVGDVYREGENALTGWARRVTEFDAGSPELPPEPDKPDELRANATNAQRQARAAAMDKWIDAHAKWKNKKNAIADDFREEQVKAAQGVLKAARRVDMFAGDISTLSPFVYQVSYNLGDLVTLVGDYGKTTKMVVREYVRTEDANGDRGFPGLVAP